MEIKQWRYKGTDEYHVGPMAQDFYAAFKLGTDERRISTIDPAGIALVSIKAMNDKVERLERTVNTLVSELEEMKIK